MSSIDKKVFGISDSLINAVNEALKGGQVKLDKNHNGKLDKQDFKMIRKEENIDELSKKTLGSYVKKASSDAASAYHDSGVAMAQKEPDIRDANKAHGRKRLAGIKTATDKLTKEETVAEGNPANKEKKNAAAAAVGAKNRDGQYLRRMNPAVADKIRGREKMSGNDRKQFEEVEQVDELSTDTYHSAAKKAAKRAMGDVQGRSGPIFKKYAGMANKFRDKGMSQEKKEKAMKEEVVDEAYGSNVGKTATGTKWSDNSVSVSVHHGDKKHTFTGKHDYVAKKLKDAHGIGMHQVNFKKASDMKEETDPGFVAEVQRRADVNMVKVRMPDGSITYKKVRAHTDVQHEANDAVSNQITAKKDAFKKQLQQKIAAKQMNTMQAKANKRLSNIHASNDKCTCQEGKGKSMSCEMHGDKSKGVKGANEPININPPMREAAELPKKVVSKGHEIAKSLIKHRAGVDNPYAVGMAQAKKSAKMKAYRTDRDKHGED